ncbi:hypothetical protein OHA74_54490 [Streptomyces phaeochromogenes]|uniref:hypothetical protein n=1 Tax=Streptomyces phaeochromogenes TaxID=1923 RepID=UPI002E29193A|nr:hypothetical protein [Streptomyces phaeochromogenes]
MTIGLLMPNPLLRNGTAGLPVETVPDEPDMMTEDRSGTDTAPLLMNLGSDDAAVCTDGVCVL